MAKKKNKKKKKKKGFTLIELLIVIAIIGILASIVLVSLSSARTRAKVAGFKSAASSLSAAWTIECDAGDVTTTSHSDVSFTFSNANCGAWNNGTANITVTPKSGGQYDGITCTAYVTPAGTQFNGNDCP